MIRGDIRNLPFSSWKDVVNILDEPIDGVIGGPSCQGFSLCGKRDIKDPRNSLFMEFAKCVKQVNLHFFVMGNVTGIMSINYPTTKDDWVLGVNLGCNQLDD